LPEGAPQRVELLSEDVSDTWVVGEEPPEDVTVSPEELPEGTKPFTLTVEGYDGEAGHPVTLRNLSRGWWRRVDASETEGEEGRYQFEVEVRRGDHLELLRNRKTLAYVVIEGYGVAAVDVNHFYGELDDVDGSDEPDYTGANVHSQVLRYVSEFELPDDEPLPGAEPLCDPLGLWETPQDLAILGGGGSSTEEQPWFVPVLLRTQGMAFLRADRNQPVDLKLVSGQCGVKMGEEDIGQATGMAVVERYPMWVIYDDPDQEDIPVDEEGEPLAEGPAERDYLVMTNTYGWVVIVDVTKREDPRVVSMIRLPEEEEEITSAANVVIDRENRRLLVSASTHGLYVVDFNGPLGILEIDVTEVEILDEDEDDRDDRVLERIEVLDGEGNPVNVVNPVLLWQELGLTWVSGVQTPTMPGEQGMVGYGHAPPEIRVVAMDKGPWRQ
ncbi:MAG: hypothetical protein GY838_10320, partial [bacterium]|nr:hypothetical protein [bacterium]